MPLRRRREQPVPTTIRIGTAAWGIPRAVAAAFPTKGTTLARYACVFDATEINSTFYRPHRPSTFERWAQSVPADFRFAIKVPRAISHEARLDGCDGLVDDFLAQIAPLGDRAGPLLLQLPPSLAFAPDKAGAVCGRLAAGGRFDICCEPRHASWFTPQVEAWLVDRRIARVAADPARHPGAGEPGGWRGLVYYRLHGSPRMYFSAYEAQALAVLAQRMEQASAPVWCVFDNTASGAAAADAMRLKQLLGVH
jgi:uncharacterized protein YecE (DUF72 family)